MEPSDCVRGPCHRHVYGREGQTLFLRASLPDRSGTAAERRQPYDHATCLPPLHEGGAHGNAGRPQPRVGIRPEVAGNGSHGAVHRFVQVNHVPPASLEDLQSRFRASVLCSSQRVRRKRCRARGRYYYYSFLGRDDSSPPDQSFSRSLFS